MKLALPTPEQQVFADAVQDLIDAHKDLPRFVKVAMLAQIIGVNLFLEGYRHPTTDISDMMDAVIANIDKGVADYSAQLIEQAEAGE